MSEESHLQRRETGSTYSCSYWGAGVVGSTLVYHDPSVSIPVSLLVGMAGMFGIGIDQALNLVELPLPSFFALCARFGTTMYDLLSLRVKLDAAEASNIASFAEIWYWLAKARTCSMQRSSIVMKSAVIAAHRLWIVPYCDGRIGRLLFICLVLVALLR